MVLNVFKGSDNLASAGQEAIRRINEKFGTDWEGKSENLYYCDNGKTYYANELPSGHRVCTQEYFLELLQQPAITEFPDLTDYLEGCTAYSVTNHYELIAGEWVSTKVTITKDQ